MRAILSAAILVLGLIGMSSAPARAQPDTVEALGVAYILGPADIDAAQRRALGDALVAAALQGGSRIRGISVLDRGTIRTDLTILEMAAEVTGYRILSRTRHENRWEVRIAARVKPPTAQYCRGNSHLVVTMRPPRIAVTPSSPAWAEEAAAHLAQSITDKVRTNPHATLDGIVAERSTRVQAGMDYASLMRGQSSPGKGNSILETSISIAPTKGISHIGVELQLTMLGPDGAKSINTTVKRFILPKSTMFRALEGPVRQQATLRIAELDSVVDGFLQKLACQPPAAYLALEGDHLSIPLGRRHGITADSIGIPDLTSNGLILLEVVRVEPSRTLLRPLDPSIPARHFAKRRVYLVKAGFTDARP
ncbi:flagellar assembly protein T N-terminal domain-containing protein [Roseovarius sp.]|jgi:hypothetical protein